MNVGQLRKAIASYLNPDFASATPPESDPWSKFTVAGTDLLMLALNNVRLTAEQARDFQQSKVDVDVVVDGYLGGSLDDVVLHGTNTSVLVKTVIDGGWRSTNGIVTPVDVVDRDNFFQELRRDIQRNDDFGPDDRYKGDQPSNFVTGSNITLLINGNDLAIYPGTTIAGTTYNIELSIYRWLDLYDNDSDTDFLTYFCQNYMLWAGIVEANHLVKQFLPRQEGNLPPPTGERDRAWAAVEKWDDFVQETGRISRLG